MNTSHLTHGRTLRVDVWSDVACPWCYVGKKRFDAALEAFPHKDDVEVVWHAYELYPDSPQRREERAAEYLADKYGTDRAATMTRAVASAAASVGLAYDCEHLRLANTFRAHQVIALATEHGLGSRMKEAFLSAYFTSGADLSETDTLVTLAVDTGLPEAEVRDALSSGAYAQRVRDDQARAQELGITGVPFFVLGEAFGVSGAQETEVFAGALTQAWETLGSELR